VGNGTALAHSTTQLYASFLAQTIMTRQGRTQKTGGVKKKMDRLLLVKTDPKM